MESESWVRVLCTNRQEFLEWQVAHPNIPAVWFEEPMRGLRNGPEGFPFVTTGTFWEATKRPDLVYELASSRGIPWKGDP